jgi:transglutaminase-like putative cysteine protease
MTNAARSTFAATLVFAAAVLLMAGKAPWWCLGIALAAAIWRLLVAGGRIPAPRSRKGMRFVSGAITAALVAAVAVNFSTLNGLAAGSALLLVMGALKLLEARSRRDDGIVVGVALFLLLAAALATQTLSIVPLYLLIIWGACAAIAIIADHGGALAPRAALRLSGRALAMSIPLAAVSFLFFPRFGGQFWALQREVQSSTGLSDEMSPGSISKLANEYDPAFRVRFEGSPPAQSALYWRGPVLNDFDGFTWRRSRQKYYTDARIEMVGAPVRYRVTLEPTQQPWLFVLDTVAQRPRRDMFMAHDRQLGMAAPITTTISYDAVSHLRTRTDGSLTALGRRHETTLPAVRNPRARALALQIRGQTGNDVEFARAVLAWFHDNGLEYTLDPGLTTVDSVDTTLFDSKKGFCGHFASSYAMMMRAAGVPARVVTGYLGGEWNSLGGYLIVRQSDAHAWNEIWLDGSGWTRVDPTAVVAPERLQRGIFDLMPDSLPATSAFLHNNALLSRLAHLWDGTNQWWQQHVVEFDTRSQLDLLSDLGIDSPDWKHLGWAFAGALGLWVAWVSLALRRGVARAKPDRIGRAWIRATRKLASVAAERAPDEGPMDYARRVALSRPDLAEHVTALAALYTKLRFGPVAPHHDIVALEREVSRLGSSARVDSNT